MIFVFQTIFWTSIFIILYVYVGYPLVLKILSIFFKKEINKKEITPSVSLIISAYNEEQAIRKKIENALKLDYPKDKLEIIVVSDCSTDKTDDIVRGYSNHAVKLIRQHERKGKTTGLNLAVPESQGEIIIFTDANSFFQSDVIKKLVRNFADKSVGYVTGESRYQETTNSPSEKSENLYWDYELSIKSMESQLGSMVGGDGAIYAIRKELYEPLEQSDINDLVNPLQIIAKGYRGIYEPEAICFEKNVDSLDQQYRRKKRIVNRSWNGLIRVKQVLNPFEFNFFSFQIISHKLLRWLIPVFMVFIFLSNIYLALNGFYFYQLMLILQTVFYSLSFIGFLNRKQEDLASIFYLPFYFCLVNFASMVGIIQYYTGNKITIWDPEREQMHGENKIQKQNISAQKLLLVLLLLFIIAIPLFVSFTVTITFIKILYWTIAISILYSYFGYPILLSLITLRKKNTLKNSDSLPTATLLIPAYNEEMDIEDKILNSLALNYPKDKLSIIIASDGSTDGTNEIIKKYEDKGIIFYPYHPRSGKISVLNRTMTKINSEIVVFSDANTMFEIDAIRYLVQHFTDPKVGAVSGDAIFKKKGSLKSALNLYYKYERFIQKKESKFCSIIGVDGAIYAIRRNLFAQLPENIILDDFVISMEIAKKGFQVIYEDKARAFESPPLSLNEEFHRRIRITAGAVQALKLKISTPSIKQWKLWIPFVSHKLIRWFTPILLVVLFSLNLLLLGSFLYNMLFIFQIIALIIISISFIFKSKIFSILNFIVFNWMGMFIGLYKGLFNKQSVKWVKFPRKKIEFVDNNFHHFIK